MIDGILRVTAVARKLGLSRSRVRQLADAGLLAAVRDASGTRLFEAAEVARFQRARRVRRTRGCRVCGRDVPPHRTYCERPFCQRARNRLRQQRFAARVKAHYGMSYRAWRRHSEDSGESSRVAC